MSTEVPPRPYRRPPHFAWWWGHRGYTLFVLRELTSLAVGVYAVLLLILVWRLGQGQEAYRAYLDWLGSPRLLVVHLIALAATVYHSVTWFGLSQKALALRVGGRPVPGRLLVAGNVAAWLVASAAVAWVLLRP
jgi:fumarate reductase subunit C